MRHLFFIFAAFFSTVCLSQVPVPSFRYSLHAQKELGRGREALLALTPENALLVLIPQADGKWVLKRLTGWDTRTPHEETLEIGSESNQDQGAWVQADLTVNPNASYLIVRIIARHGAIGPIDPAHKEC